MELRIYAGNEDLAEIDALWSSLASSVPLSRLKHYPDVYLSYLDAFELDPEDFFIAAIFDSEVLVAVLPLCFNVRKFLGFNFRVLGFPHCPFPIRDILISQSHSVEEILKYIISNIGVELEQKWDYFQFYSILESSHLYCDQRKGVARYYLGKHIGFSHLIDVKEPGCAERKLSSGARNNLRRFRKRLSACGKFEFKTVDKWPELKEAYHSFLETEAAGWKSIRGGKLAVKMHKDQTKFYSNLICRYADKGHVHIHLLYLNGVAIASDFCVLTKNKCYSFKHGYDENCARMGPSNLLREYTLDYYGKSGLIDGIDLISGYDWQLRWRPQRRRIFDVKIFNARPKGILLFCLFQFRQVCLDHQSYA